MTETAWQHDRDHHVIRVRQSLAPAVKLHMRAHELCRLILLAEARNAGTNLFQIWERETAQPTPGSEYALVAMFAADLRLTGWFRWIDDPGEATPREVPAGSSNPELLALKSPVAVFYFLEILKRLDLLDAEEIQRVGAEAALAGKDGLDYASPEKNYRVPSFGEEMLSGLEVMCIMFAAFQRFAPQQDLAIDLHDPYQKALALHEGRKREGQ